MRELDSRRLKTRIKGRDTLTRSLRLLLIRVHRFGRLRARTTADQHWAQVLTDALQDALRQSDQE